MLLTSQWSLLFSVTMFAAKEEATKQFPATDWDSRSSVFNQRMNVIKDIVWGHKTYFITSNHQLAHCP